MSRGAVRDDDGRLARSRRTRAAVTRALLDLVRAGNTSPTVSDIADRAGVTPRSVHTHFPSVSDLHRAASDLATAEVLELVDPIDVELPLAGRIQALARQRALVHEHLAPLRRAARLFEASSPALSEARRAALEASTDQVARVFGRELGALPRRDRQRAVAGLASLVGDDSWALWRGHFDMSVDEARSTMVDGVTALVASLADQAAR